MSKHFVSSISCNDPKIQVLYIIDHQQIKRLQHLLLNFSAGFADIYNFQLIICRFLLYGIVLLHIITKCETKTFLVKVGSDETGQWMEWHVGVGRGREAHPHSIPKSKTKQGKQFESAEHSFTIHQRKQMLDAIHKARIKGGRGGKGKSESTLYSYTIQQRTPKLDVRHHARRREGRGGKGKRESR